MRPGSDTLQSLVDYITHFAGELFASGPTRCRQDVAADLPVRTLPPDVRHNIFLIVKEALTNTLRHAGATEVNLQIQASPRHLAIVISKRQGIRCVRRHRRRQAQRLGEHAPPRRSRRRPSRFDQFAAGRHAHGIHRRFYWLTRPTLRLCSDSRPLDMQIKVAIVDDDEVIRSSLSTLLKRAPGYKLVGEYANAETALKNSRKPSPMSC